MKQTFLAAVLLAGSMPAAAAKPEGVPPRPAETEEQAIRRIFYPAYHLNMELRGPLDRHPITRAAFEILGMARGCEAYRKAWLGAFDRHLPTWNRVYHAAVKSVVPPEALRTESRRMFDPTVIDVYGARVAAALNASEAKSSIRSAMAAEILTELRAAAEAGPASTEPANPDPNTPGGIGIKCGVTSDFLERRGSVLGS